MVVGWSLHLTFVVMDYYIFIGKVIVKIKPMFSLFIILFLFIDLFSNWKPELSVVIDFNAVVISSIYGMKL